MITIHPRHEPEVLAANAAKPPPAHIIPTWAVSPQATDRRQANLYGMADWIPARVHA